MDRLYKMNSAGPLTQLKCDEANRGGSADEPSQPSSVIDFSIRSKQLKSMKWRKGFVPEMLELKCISVLNLNLITTFSVVLAIREV